MNHTEFFKMIVDNFQLIKDKLIDVDTNSEKFWFLQILIRGKDGHDEVGVNGNNKNRLIKFYIIKGKNDLDKYEQEIKSICDVVNGRAYIHPTARSFREVANEMFRNFSETYISHNDLGLRNCYSTAASKSYITSDKKYIVDLDDDFAEPERKQGIIDVINSGAIRPEGNKVLFEVPTLHGVHLICKPFDVGTFSQIFPTIDVHKNNPTLVYYNKPQDESEQF